MSLCHIACTDVPDQPDPRKDGEQIGKEREDVPAEEEGVKVEAKNLQLNRLFSRQGLDSLRVLREPSHSYHDQ